MSENTTTRPLGVAHLIFGLVFTGIAAIWFIGEANDIDVPDLAIAFPAVLIGAGVIGLVATLVNHSRAKNQALVETPAAERTEAPEETTGTTVLTTEEDPS